jgi:hypothetical protein
MNPSPKRPSTTQVQRRHFLGAIGAGSIFGLSGCLGGSDIKDSDGDGVIDSQDYAPRDASVQESADMRGTARVTPVATEARETPEVTTTPTSTPTPTPLSEYGTISATNPGLQEGGNYIADYSPEHVTVQLVAEDVDGIVAAGNDLLVVIAEFPREKEYGVFRQSFTPPSSGYSSVEVPIQFPAAAEDKTVHFLVFFINEDISESAATSADLKMVAESDPFIVDTTTETIRREQPTVLDSLKPVSGDFFSREETEGAYALTLEGRTQGTAWSASYLIYKSAYAVAVGRDRGRSREEFVAFEMQDGFAGEFAGLLSSIAADHGISDERTQVEFIIDFVQRLPYVSDIVSTGFDDYTKFSIETLTELGGDCEDTSIMLAGLLQSPPFGYDMVLIQPPEHMGVGIYGSDLYGSYWEEGGRDYYYIETTGEGWGIGDFPESLDDSAYVYQV